MTTLAQLDALFNNQIFDLGGIAVGPRGHLRLQLRHPDADQPIRPALRATSCSRRCRSRRATCSSAPACSAGCCCAAGAAAAAACSFEIIATRAAPPLRLITRRGSCRGTDRLPAEVGGLAAEIVRRRSAPGSAAAAGLAGGLRHVADVARDLAGALGRLLDVAGDLLGRRALLLDRGGDAGRDLADLADRAVMSPIASTGFLVAFCISAICAEISSVALAVWLASAFTSRGDHGEALARLAGARRLDRGVERQQIGLRRRCR